MATPSAADTSHFRAARLSPSGRGTAAFTSALCLTIVGACGAPSLDPPPGTSPSNVIILLVDTLRADHVGCYGYKRDTSPNLDAFAEEAIRFETVTSQAPWTNPSVASILTSLYPSTHHLMTFKKDGKIRRLADSATTLAEALRDNGYHTAAITTNPWISRNTGLDQGFDTFKRLRVGKGGESAPAPELNGKALEWLTTLSAEPFFLFLHYMDVHGPYLPPEPYRSMFSDPETPPRLLTDREKKWIPRYLKIDGAETLDVYIDRYDGQIRFWDDHFAELMERLASGGFLDNTIILVTSDHGEEFLDHGGWNHGPKLYEEQIAVPMIMRLPADRHRASTIPDEVELIDIMPTILSLAGIDPVTGQQGDDLSPLIAGEPWQPRPAFSEAAVKGGGFPLPKGVLKSVRVGDIKTIANLTTGEAMAFDLSTNPREDLATAKAAGIPTDSGRAAIDAWFEVNTVLGERYRPTAFDHDPELVEQLEALGYVED
jgi:arylsulfatase A-like enzyme